MQSLYRLEAALSRALEAAVALCLLVFLGLIATTTLLRYLFNTGIVGANETATVLFVYATALGAAVAAGRREHIAVTFLVDKLGERARRAAAGLAFALVALINGVVVWQSLRWIAVTGGYLMPATQAPRIVAQLAVPVGCGLAVVYCLIGIATTLKGDRGTSRV